MKLDIYENLHEDLVIKCDGDYQEKKKYIEDMNDELESLRCLKIVFHNWLHGIKANSEKFPEYMEQNKLIINFIEGIEESARKRYERNK